MGKPNNFDFSEIIVGDYADIFLARILSNIHEDSAVSPRVDLRLERSINI